MQYPIKMIELLSTPKYQQEQRIREIISESTQYADWLPIPEEFHSGEEMGFDLGGVSIRGNVVFDKYGVTVNLTSPVVNRACRDIYHRRQTFFSRNPPGASLFVGGVEGGPAIPECIEVAKEINQQQYVENKRPLHEVIVALLREAEKKDPFQTLFSSELDDCEYAMDKKKLIESI